MELAIEVQSAQSYLYIRVLGTYEIERAKALFIDALKAADNSGQSRILIDYREMQGTASTIDNYDYSDFVASYLLERQLDEERPQLRLAYVGSGINFDPSRFAETVAVNRGVEVLNTDNMEAAIEWLQGDLRA